MMFDHQNSASNLAIVDIIPEMEDQYLPELKTSQNLVSPVAIISPETEKRRRESMMHKHASQNYVSSAEYLTTTNTAKADDQNYTHQRIINIGRIAKDKKNQQKYEEEREKRQQHQKAHAQNVMRSFASTSRHSSIDHANKYPNTQIKTGRLTSFENCAAAATCGSSPSMLQEQNQAAKTFAHLPKIKILRNTEDIIQKSQKENRLIKQLGKSIVQS